MNYTLSKTEQEILELLWDKNQWMSGANFWEYFNELSPKEQRNEEEEENTSEDNRING